MKLKISLSSRLEIAKCTRILLLFMFSLNVTLKRLFHSCFIFTFITVEPLILMFCRNVILKITF